MHHASTRSFVDVLLDPSLIVSRVSGPLREELEGLCILLASPVVVLARLGVGSGEGGKVGARGKGEDGSRVEGMSD